MRKQLSLILFLLLVPQVMATEPLGLSLQQEVMIGSMIGTESPIRYAYLSRLDWREPFRSVDSLARDRRTTDLLRFQASTILSPFFGEVKGAFYISPFAPLELGTFFSMQLFPSSNQGMIIDSLHSSWNERSLGRQSWNTDGVEYLQVAAFIVALRGQISRTLLAASWTTVTLDVNTDKGASGARTSAYYYGWDLPVQHGDNITNWELSGEYAFGEAIREKSWTLGSRLRLTGASSEIRLLFDPRSSSEDVAQLRADFWLGIPFSEKWRLVAGSFYSVHSKGGGEGILSDRLGLLLRISWHWHHESFALSEQ